MAGIDVLASFVIGTAELDAYGRADPPRARRAARSGAAPRTARPNPAASVPRPGSGLLHRRPWAREARQFPSRGLQRQGEHPEEGCCVLSNFERLRKRIFLIFGKSGPRK